MASVNVIGGTMPKNRLLACLVTIAALCNPNLAAAKWLRADTHNFIIYSTGGASQLTAFSTNVERFDALLRHRFHVEREEKPNRLTIYLLSSPEDVARLYGNKKVEAAGIYIARPDGSFAVANRVVTENDWELSGNTVLFHEYAHHFMFHYFNAPYPAWYVEGFAEFVSTATFKPGGEWVLGAAANHRAYGLFQTQGIKIDQLLFGDAVRRDTDETDAFYGRAWLLVHMLSMDSALRTQLNNYVNALIAGKPPREAAASAFGDLAQLDKALDRYLARTKIPAIISRTPLPIDGTITLTELDEVTAKLIALQLDRKFHKKPAQTREGLRALSDASPTSASVWQERALAEHDEFEIAATDADRIAVLDRAEPLVDRALAIEPGHPRANVLKARIAIERLKIANDDSPAKWRAARSFAAKANVADNDDPAALIAWYDGFAMGGKEPPQNARDGLMRAFQLAPEADEIRVRLAFDFANHKDYANAIRIMEILVAGPHSDPRSAAILAQIKARRDAETKATIQSAPSAKPEPASPVPLPSQPASR